MLKRVLFALIAVMCVGVAPQAALARGGGGGFRGGGGGGFRGGGGGFRGGGYRGGGFRGAGLGLGVGLGLGAYGAYGGYGYGNSCIRLRRVWTPYGYQLRRVNVCY